VSCGRWYVADDLKPHLPGLSGGTCLGCTIQQDHLLPADRETLETLDLLSEHHRGFASEAELRQTLAEVDEACSHIWKLPACPACGIVTETNPCPYCAHDTDPQFAYNWFRGAA
jgi:hypothetical protein